MSGEDGKSKNDYSGVIFMLKDLYGLMKSNVTYDKIGDFFMDIKTGPIVDRIERDINLKFKDV
jgi:hypothetical protein